MIKTLSLGFASLVLVGACASDTSNAPSKDDIRAQGKTDDGHDWCGELGWYGDHICDDFCIKRDPDCATDSREPELASPSDVLKSKLSMSQGLAQAAQRAIPTIRGSRAGYGVYVLAPDNTVHYLFIS